jgi:hypothetical protein
VVNQKRKWEKALLASAILWVSSRFFTAAPSPLEAAINSAGKFFVHGLFVAARVYCDQPFDTNGDPALLGRTSVGTWKVAPPTRRLRTSTYRHDIFERTLENLNRHFHSSLVSTISNASYMIWYAKFFLPSSIMLFTKRELASSFPNLGSGSTYLFLALLFSLY